MNPDECEHDWIARSVFSPGVSYVIVCQRCGSQLTAYPPTYGSGFPITIYQKSDCDNVTVLSEDVQRERRNSEHKR